ncbi:MAG: glycosyltransferase family 2 protein [Candidatus Gastranaerophilaceae bacterium]
MIFDDFIINILVILFIYLILYIIYFAFNIFICTKKHKIGLEHKYLAQDLPGNLIVIVYAKQGDSGVLKLVQMLKRQNYPKENYQVHVLFDNCTDNYPDILEKEGAVKVWRINKGSAMGKDDAIGWILERLISFRNVNAFIFLDAERQIAPDFLKNVNSALFSSDVVVPSVEYIIAQGDVVSAIMNHAKKYVNRIFNTSRTILNLMSPINSGAVAIKQEVLEELKCVDFHDRESEYKYSIFLACNGYTPLFAPDVKSYAYYGEQEELSVKQKLSVTKYLLSKVFSGNFKLLEIPLSFCKPSSSTIIFLYVLFFVFLYNFEVKNFLFQDIRFVSVAAGITFVMFLISLVVASEEKINPIFLALTPIYHFLGKLFTPKAIKYEDYEENQNENIPPLANATEVSVSDGENILKCLIEIKNTGDGYQVIFRYKSKMLMSETYETPKQALDEIQNKLSQNDLKINICAECSHFGLKPNASVQTGLCSHSEKMTGDIQPETTLLDSCKYFQCISDLDNVVEFKKQDSAE